jgi:hypothetical protein
MDGRRVPDLQEMAQREATQFLTELANNLSPEQEYRIRHPEDYVMEMPQSGERIRGREKMREFQEAYPDHSDPPSIRIRRVLVRDRLWVAEAVADYGSEQVFHGASILELKDGKIWRERRYYAEPFEAPEWRAQLVERKEP